MASRDRRLRFSCARNGVTVERGITSLHSTSTTAHSLADSMTMGGQRRTPAALVLKVDQQRKHFKVRRTCARQGKREEEASDLDQLVTCTSLAPHLHHQHAASFSVVRCRNRDVVHAWCLPQLKHRSLSDRLHVLQQDAVRLSSRECTCVEASQNAIEISASFISNASCWLTQSRLLTKICIV